jgi:hypothetical protein
VAKWEMGTTFIYFGTIWRNWVNQVAPGGKTVLCRIERPPSNERAAQRLERIGALGDKKIDLHFMVAKSS